VALARAKGSPGLRPLRPVTCASTPNYTTYHPTTSRSCSGFRMGKQSSFLHVPVARPRAVRPAATGQRRLTTPAASIALADAQLPGRPCFGLDTANHRASAWCAGWREQNSPLGPSRLKSEAHAGTAWRALRMRFGDQDSEIRGRSRELEQDEERKAGRPRGPKRSKNAKPKRRRCRQQDRGAGKEPQLQRLLPDEPSTAANPARRQGEFPQRSARTFHPPRPDLPQFGSFQGWR